MARLNATVYLMDEGDIKGYGPDDDVPEHIARQIGVHAWEGGVHPYPGDGDGDGVTDRRPGEAPPRAGKGSSRDAWVAFASEKGMTVSDGDTRDDLIGKCERAGVVESQS